MTLVWKSGWNGLTEPEAIDYVAAVEAADGQELEFGVAKAINDFVLGCKLDGIWNAIKASCILAGASTLDGALVPLVGGAPTNNNFVSGDYDRETGLKGDGSTKYIDTGRDNNADPQNNNHISVYVTEEVTSPNTPQIFMAASGGTGSVTRLIQNANNNLNVKSNDSGALYTIVANGGLGTGLKGVARSSSSSYTVRTNALNTTGSNASDIPDNTRLSVFRRTDNTQYLTARLSFYSIGESLDLAALDTRVSNLMTAIGAAIP